MIDHNDTFYIHNFLESKGIKLDYDDCSLIRGIIIHYSSNLNEIKKIILNKSLSSEQKQKELESISSVFERTNKAMLNNLPLSKTFKDFIEKLDLYTNQEDPLKLTSSYLIYSFSSIKSKSKPIKPRIEKLQFYKDLSFFYKLNRFLNYSNGLIIAFYISKAIRLQIIQDLGQFYVYNERLKKRVFIYDLSNVFIKTKVLNSVATSILDCRCHISKKVLEILCLKNKKGISLNEEEKFLFDKLSIDTVGTKIDHYEVANLMGLLATYFDLTGLFINKTVYVPSNETKTINIYKLQEEFCNDLLSLTFDSSNLPCICLPNDWILSLDGKSSVNIHSGGHFSDVTLSTPAYKTKNSKDIVSAVKDDLEAINYLQSIPYCINVNYLNFLLNNLHLVTNLYLYNNENLSKKRFNIFTVLEKNTIVIMSIKEFVNNDSIYKDIQLSLNSDVENKDDLKKKLYSRKVELRKVYRNYILRFFVLIYTLSIAELYSNVNHYYRVIMDFRGRIYFPTFPFGPQTGSLGHSLIEGVVSNENTVIPNKNIYDYYVNHIKNSSKEAFLFLKSENGFKYNFIGLDVTCSGIQIVSGITGFLEGLIKTNLLYTKETPKQDLYGEFTEFFLSKYPVSVDRSIIVRYLKESDNTDINLDDSIDNIESIKDDSLILSSKVLLIFKQYFTRNNLKYWIMSLVYSEGNRSRALHLIEFYQTNKSLFSSLSGNYSRKFIYMIAFFLSKTFESLLYEKYPSLGIFSKFVIKNVANKKNILKNEGVWLCNNKDSLKVFYTEMKTEVKKFDHKDSNNHRIQFSLTIKKDEVDTRSFPNSVVPNFIHFLDSRLAIHVINSCKNNGNIPLYTNHDCFYVPSCYGEKLKLFYFDAFKKILLCDDVLTFFFMSNNLNPIVFKSFVDDINLKKKNILSLIDNGILKPSTFIIS